MLPTVQYRICHSFGRVSSSKHTRPKIESWCGRHTAAGPPLINSAITCSNLCQNSRGRILGRYPGKSLMSFPPFYSESPQQLCMEISISSTSYYFYRVSLYSVKEKVGKTYIKPYPLPYGLRNTYRNLKFDPQIMPNLKEIVRSGIRLQEKGGGG